MYVLRDVKVKYQDLTAQIDYVVITPVYTYYIECKNLTGNIIVNEKGDFIRELIINGKKEKKGMYSPLRQVEAQREVIRKIWENNTSTFHKLFASKNFDYYRRVLVVAANQDTILNTSKAPKEIKNKIIRADALVKQIANDLKERRDDEYFSSQKNMLSIAQAYMDICDKEKPDFYEYYKTKYGMKEKNTEKEKDFYRDELIKFRKKRASEMNIPAFYVFNNEELEKLIEMRPETIEKLRSAKILPEIKIKTHGEKIIEELNDIAKRK